jgi:AcrR family transcriptional regulator
MADARAPRRLSKSARREQLVTVAMPILADEGFAEFSLEDIAAQADVTRNLLYHYFPRGRPDVVVAVVDRAGRELTDDWMTDPELPLAERLEANFEHIARHALSPSDAWRIHRKARAADQADLNEIVAGYLEIVISSISLNHLGTSEPPPLVHLALTGYLAAAETIVDGARTTNAPREQVLQILGETLVATVAAARKASRA